MNWFQQLKIALPEYYPSQSPQDIVGFLQGSPSWATWKQMATLHNRHQMLILGSVPPVAEDWVAAGVAQRAIVQTIRISDLGGWIVLYGGFVRRPWGKLFETSREAETIGFPAALQQWLRNKPRR